MAILYCVLHDGIEPPANLGLESSALPTELMELVEKEAFRLQIVNYLLRILSLPSLRQDLNVLLNCMYSHKAP